jgi:hypothetical protein
VSAVIPDPPPGPPPARPNRWLPWALRVLRLYPPAWRARYGAEMADVLARHRLTGRTLLDLGRGAVDAWLHPALTEAEAPTRPGRGVAVTTFGVFAAFSAAYFPLFVVVADPEDVSNRPTGYSALATGVPVLRASTVVMQVGFLVALLAILAGLLVLALAAGRRAVGARHWPVLGGAAALAVATVAAAARYVRPPHASGLADVGTVCSPTACTVGPGIGLFALALAAGVLGLLLLVTPHRGRRGEDAAAPDGWWRLVVASNAVAIVAMAATLLGSAAWGLTVWAYADHLPAGVVGATPVAFAFAAGTLVMAGLTAVAVATFGRSVVASGR